MKKLYTIAALAAMFLGSLTANAQEEGPKCSLPQENEVLMSETFHMRLFKTWDFLAKTVNGKAFVGPLTFGPNDTSMPACDGYRPQPILNAGLKGWHMGIGNIELNDSKGLYNNKNGIRYVILTGLKAGQIISIENTSGSEKLSERVYAEDGSYEDIKIHDYAVNACRIQNASPDGKYPGWTISYLENQNTDDKNVVMEITDSIHAEQALNPTIIEKEEGNDTIYHDNFRYFRAVIDGPLYIAMGKNAAIQGVQIWIDAYAEESVSVPTYQLTSVNGQVREFDCVCGESTFGADCKIMYGFPEEDGYSEPDNEYDGTIIVSPDEDYNGDGKVSVECMTVSDLGTKSEIVTFDVDIADITLNAPVLTLVGFNGEERTYQIEWTNNTLCKEVVTFKASGDDDDVFLEEPKAGDLITVKKNATVSVSATGYTDNTTTIDVDYPGVTIVRKNTPEEEGANDIDLVKPTQEQIDLVKGNKIESVYIEDAEGNKTYYTEEEYKIGEANDGTDLSGDNVVVVKVDGGWNEWDGSRNRTTLKVITDTIVTPGEEQNDTTYQYHYAEDKAHFFPEGIKFECGPNSAGTSQVLNYLGNNDLGITCMSAPTLTFDRSILKAGELVAITIGAAGGSNYLSADANGQTTKTLVYIAPVEEPLKVTLPRPATNFCHILNINFFTLPDLPEDQYDPVAVESIADTTIAPVEIYSISGTKANGLQKGINIVKMSDGSVKKVMVK